MIHFIRYVAEAIAEAGVKGLAGMVPGGPFAIAVAEGVWKKVRSAPKTAADTRAEVEQLAQATADKTAAAVEQAVQAAVPPGIATHDDIVTLKQYLTRIPEQVRQSLKRADDPSGRTAPPSFVLASPVGVMQLLPPRPPRFRAGDPVPGLDGWFLRRPLGVGGFGEVWFAQHAQMEALNGAVKFCFGDTAQALIHEAALIDRVMKAGDHPNIVRPQNVRLSGDTPWLLFDYVDAMPDWVFQFAKLPQAERVEKWRKAFDPVLAAVAHFHALTPPVVHRDLKPSNILYDRVTKKFRVTDFGIGSVTVQEAVQPGALSGHLLSSLHGSHTPLFASPQQRRWPAGPA